VRRHLDLIAKIVSPALFLLLAAGSVAAADRELWETAQEPDASVSPLHAALHVEKGSDPAEDEADPADDQNETTDELPVEPAPPAEGRQVDTLEQKGGFLGYNFVTSDGYGGRAYEYGFLRSSRSGGLFYRSLTKDSNFDLEGNFLNRHDYHGDLLLDYQGDYRAHLRTESLFHNLDREILFAPSFGAGRTDAPTLADYSAVQDTPQAYGVSVSQDNADFRYRLHNYPLHVNLGYWRLVREGNIQQRFSDASFEGTPDTIYAVRRHVDQLTQEGRVGIDAHLGFIDLIYDLRVRVFRDQEPVPFAGYVSRNDIHGTPERVGGFHQHNENPDASLISNTVKLHSALSGGLVAAGSYSIEQRENHSRLSDTRGGKGITATLHNAAGDLVYTPGKEYSFSVKYRRQELDYDRPGLVVSNNFVNPLQIVKPAMNLAKDIVTATASYHPRHDLSVVGEYKGEFLKRDNVSDLPTPLSWALPESTETHTGTLASYWRPAKGLRVSANYLYSTTDHPSYGASYQQKHEGRVLATYSRNGSWGTTANFIVRREWNNEVEHFLVNYPLDPLGYTPYPLTAREKESRNANLSFWFVPVERLTLGANYAYVQSQVDQSVLFTGVVVGSEAPSRYFNRSQVYGVNAAYALDENTDLSLMLQQVRTSSVFDPELKNFSATSDTLGVRDITRVNTVISEASARGEYRFTRALSSSLEYAVRDYNERNIFYRAYNGTVHTIFATVAGKW
jgi:hypothetical protein